MGCISNFLNKFLNKEETKTECEKNVIYSPLKGEAMELKKVSDATFADELLGKGFAINPSEGKLVAPFNGKIVTLFPTKHAICIVSDDGIELLIHIGFNTVELNGKYYKEHVKEGDTVSKGQTLMTFDIKGIKNSGYETTTPIVITNSDNYKNISVLKTGDIVFGDKSIKVE